jgi:hypothetical protein
LKPRTPDKRISPTVIFCGREGMAHQTAAPADQQIVNPLGIGTAISHGS